MSARGRMWRLNWQLDSSDATIAISVCLRVNIATPPVRKVSNSEQPVVFVVTYSSR